jgi:WD40 repeat protein
MLLIATVLLLCHAPRVDAETPPLATLVETITGEAVPWKNNSVTNQTSDMVKICDLKIGGRFLLVCTYYSTTLCVFERDPVTAKLTFRNSFENPYKSRWHWANLYTRELATGEVVLYYLYKGAIHWYQVDGKTGACTETGKLDKVGNAPAVFSPDGKRLFTSGAVLLRDVKGALSVESRRNSTAATRAFAPDNKHFYECTHTNITVCAYDPATGTTRELFRLDLTGPDRDPKPARTFMSLSPDGRFLYVGQQSEGYGAKKKWFSWVLERNCETGALTIKSSGPPPRDLTYVEECLFAPDGSSGYFIQADPADTEGYRSCAAWFSRDPDKGTMTFQGKGPAGRTCCMDWDAANGAFYAGTCGQNAKNSQIFVFKIPATTPK